MSYMSYCQFEGVSGDLGNCITALNREEIESSREEFYAKRIREMCEDYIRAYDNSIYGENDD